MASAANTLLPVWFFGVFGFSYVAWIVFRFVRRRFFPTECERWEDLHIELPENPTAENAPSFYEQTENTVRGITYGQWCEQFDYWVQFGEVRHRGRHWTWTGGRMLDGRDWALEDRKWAKLAEKWDREVYWPENKRRSDALKARNERLKLELLSRFVKRYGYTPTYVPDQFLLCEYPYIDCRRYSPKFEAGERIR